LSTLSTSISCKYQLITKKIYTIGNSFEEDEKYELFDYMNRITEFCAQRITAS